MFKNTFFLKNNIHLFKMYRKSRYSEVPVTDFSTPINKKTSTYCIFSP